MRTAATINLIHSRHEIQFGETARFMPKTDRIIITEHVEAHMKHKPYSLDFNKNKGE